MSYLYPAESEGSVFYRESSEAGLITNDCKLYQPGPGWCE